MYIVLWALGPTRLLVQHIFLYYTLVYTTHICLLYKATNVYSIIVWNTIQSFGISYKTKDMKRTSNYIECQVKHLNDSYHGQAINVE